MKKKRQSIPEVGVIMGSSSDWNTMKYTTTTLESLNILYEVDVISAHRTPNKLFSYAENAEKKGLSVIISGAGGAAHLPGMLAAKTIIPILGVPIKSKVLNGIDSLLSIVQMPAGIPVGTLAIGKAGAINAALLAGSIIANVNKKVRNALNEYRRSQSEEVLANSKPEEEGK